MKKQLNTAIAVLFLATASMAATAAENESKISYDYVYGGLASLTVDGVSGSLDLTEVGVSTSLTDNIAVGFSTTWNRNLPAIDLRINTFGAMYHTPLSVDTDLQVGISRTNATITAGSYGSASVTATGYSLGAKTMLTDDAFASFTIERTSGDSTTATELEIGTYVTNDIAISAGIVNDGVVDITFAGVSFHY